MRRLREITLHTVDREPKWRHRGHDLDTGYDARMWDGNGRSAPMKDDSVTVRGQGHPEFSGKSVTSRGESHKKPGHYHHLTGTPSEEERPDRTTRPH